MKIFSIVVFHCAFKQRNLRVYKIFKKGEGMKSSDSPRILALDIGGTKIFWAVLNDRGMMLKKKTEPHTQKSSQEALIKQIVQIAKNARSNMKVKEFSYVAIATPGLVDCNGKICYAVNLPWLNTPLKEILEKRLETSVIVENDAKAAALGEFYYGVGTGAKNLLYMTIGTGIGGALVLEGKLYRGSYNIAGEFGHFSIDPNGYLCPCGNRGCLDLYASGTAIAQMAQKQLQSGRKSLLLKHQNKRETITAKLVINAAKNGDKLSQQIVSDAGRSLGVGIVNLIRAFDPDRIVLGGSIVKAGKLFLDPMKSVVNNRRFKHATKPAIAVSKLGHKAGILGLVSLTRSKEND